MNMQQMMRQAQKMQKELAKAQEEIANMTFEGSAGGGMVTATARGDMSIASIRIDPEALDPEDTDMLEDMICAAVNEALRGVNDMSNARMGALTGGMNIPGMGGMPGLR
ncbi:MAG: YbaB/EbfC family nucleoid-associated protein [Eggerthellaceae bacterium]